ncbi:unnamed protein product [Caenorhabditis brenneri]
MTIHKHLRQSHRKEHPFRSPEEEEDLAHIHITLRYALIIFGLVPFTLFLGSIWISAHPHFTEPYDQSNRTQFIRANFRWNETGNGRIWIPWENNTKLDLGSWWNPLFVDNQTTYTYGINNHTFCNTRKDKFYKYSWTTSIYRSSQMYASVQTALRYGVLFVFLPFVFNAFILAKSLVIQHKSLSSAIIAVAYFSNEVCLHISYFALTTLHYSHEGDYIPISSIYFSIAMILSISKLMLRNFTEPVGVPTIVRSVGVFILILAYDPLRESVQEFIDHVYCDTFVSPTICYLELTCLLILFFNNLNDIHQLNAVHLVVSQTIDDVNVQKMATKSVFRRVKSSN